MDLDIAFVKLDRLARIRGLQEADFLVFDSPLVDLPSSIDFDFNGLCLTRRCLENLFVL